MTDRAKQIVEILQGLKDNTPHILCIPRPDDVPGNHPVMLSMGVETADNAVPEAAMMLGEIVDSYRLAGLNVEEILQAVREYLESKA